VLLAGRDGDTWRRAAQGLGTSWLPLIAFTVGKDGDLSDPDGDWHDAYGVGPDGRYWSDRTAMSRGAAGQALRTRWKSCAGRSMACPAGCPR